MIISFTFAFILALFAGLYDLKTSNVHEEVPALLISFGIFGWLMYSLMNANLFYIIASLYTGIAFTLTGLLLYKAKIWGDGDAWILGGLGFCIPYFSTFLSPFTDLISYSAYFLFNLFFVGGIYSIIYILAYGALNRNVWGELGHEFNKHKAIYLGCIAGSLIASVFVPLFFLIGILPPLYIYAKVIEASMKRKISVKDLTGDDVLAGGDIRGLNEVEIEEIRRTKQIVEVQEGIRFTMVFSLTLVFLYFGGFFNLVSYFIII